MSAITCPHCEICLTSQEATAPRCESCGEALPHNMRRRTRVTEQADATVEPEVRPWTPWQILAISFAFGTAACGIVMGVNFARMGQSARAIPSVLAAIIVFLVQASLIIFLVPEQSARLACVVSNLAIGTVFMLIQKPDFDAWKNANWPFESYKPNGIGLLILVSLGGLAIEIVILGGLVILGHGKEALL